MKKIIVLPVFILWLGVGFSQLNAPTILVQPQDQTEVCPYNYVQFIVNGLNIDSYQWQESQDGGNSWSNISDNIVPYMGTNNDTLLVFADVNVNGFQYRCIVYNSSGDSAISDAALLSLDSQPPQITTQSAPVTVYIDMFGSANIMFSDVITSATDNCAIMDSSVTPSSLDCGYIGDTVMVLVTATDGSGNSTTDTAYVTVADTTPPTGTGLISYAYINDTGYAYVDPASALLYASDNCEIADTSVYPEYFTCSEAGSAQDVNIILTDTYGNTDTVTVQVMVMDTVPPQIQCVNDTVINLPPGDTVYTVQDFQFDPVATDNCGINIITNSYTMTSTLYGAEFGEGTTQVMWTAYDNSGMAATCTFTITVNLYVSDGWTEQKRVKVYPNPATDKVFIDLPEDNCTVKVYDISGKEIQTYNNVSGTVKVDLSKQPTGIYMIKTIGQNFVKVNKVTLKQ